MGLFCLTPPAWATSLVQTGFYVGNGADDRPITGVGFRPDLVIVKAVNSGEPVLRTSTMTGDASKGAEAGAPLAVNVIQGLDADGFTVGTDNRVNQAGVTFHWIAFRAKAGELVVGSYTGDGVDNRSIGGIGFQPELVMVIPGLVNDPVFRTSTMGAGDTFLIQGSSPLPNIIQLLEANGFQVGTSANVNTNGSPYHYVAWNAVATRMAVGTYTGNGADNRSIPGVGFRPEFLIVKRDAMSGSVATVFKTESTGVTTDQSLRFRSDPIESNNLQALEVDGFQVGNDQRVNGGGDTFHYMAFGSVEVNYRSIGTAGPYTTGTVTATAGSRLVTGAGVAWLTNNRGRGDRITIDGLHYQIESIVSESQVLLRRPFGGTTGSGKGYTIARQFTTLTAWEMCVDSSGGCGFFPVGSASLVTDSRREIGVAYKDTRFFEAIVIDGSVTDANHDITLTADPGNRHRGIPWDGVSATPHVVVETNVAAGPIGIQDDFVAIEYLELIQGTAGVELGNLSAGVGANFIRIQNNYIHEAGTGIDVPGEAILDVINNVFDDNSRVMDFSLMDGTSRVRVLNNTAFKSAFGGIGGTPFAHPTVLLQNNIVMGTGFGDDFDVPSPDPASSNNISEDNTAPTLGIGTQRTLAQVAFVDENNGDLHIGSASVAKDQGSDLSSIFTIDVDDETRVAPWDIGADEIGVSVNYRSIGTDTHYSTGTITATAGLAVVTGAGGADWVTGNRGRGDRIDIGGTNYTVLSVDSVTQLTLTTPAAANYAGGYTISRKFGTLQAWEDCISDEGACTYDAVASGDLAADNRTEVGIAYDDSVFTVGMIFDNATTDTAHTITLTADDGNRHYGRIDGGVVIDAGDETGEIRIEVDNVTVEWLEIRNVSGGAGNPAAVVPRNVVNAVINQMLLHDNEHGVRLTGSGGQTATVRNSFVFSSGAQGIRGDEATDTIVVDNCTIYGSTEEGIREDSGTVIHVRNSIVMNSGGTGDLDVGSGTQSHNISSDGTAAGPGSLTNRTATANTTPPAGDWVIFQNLGSGTENLHLVDNPAENDAINAGVDLSTSFTTDIDGALRSVLWDVGADDVAATTAVELVSLESTGYDGEVLLEWETGSELDNLGFHVYRSLRPEGPYERVTSRAIPGLGSSPEGATYHYVDTDVANGETYYYELEDIDASGETLRHGPVSARPDGSSEPSPGVVPGLTYGEPLSSAVTVRERDRRVVLELRTSGFYADALEDGTVALRVPEYGSTDESPSVPMKSVWLNAVAGRDVRIVSIQPKELERFDLVPSDGDVPELVATSRGTVKGRQRRKLRSARNRNTARDWARVASVGYQGDEKKALLELAPLYWDARSGELVLARRLVVVVSFNKPEPKPGRARKRAGRVVARLGTTTAGLYGASYEELFRRGRIRSERLSLSRRGQPHPFHIEPNGHWFGPGSTLYFVSDGAAQNAWGDEAVYELSFDGESERMDVLDDEGANGPLLSSYRHRVSREENHLYQAGLVDAPDRWLWELLFAPVAKSYAFEVSALADGESELSVWLQGTSELEGSPDHHVRAFVNGGLVGEVSWDGKRDVRLDAAVASGLLREGTNELTLEKRG